MTNYTDYPFTYQGFNFISRIASHSPFNSAIARIGLDEFAKLNRMALADLLPASVYTLDEIKTALDSFNKGASHAWLLLEGVEA